MKKSLLTAALLGFAAASTPASAADTIFVPPSDTVGSVFSTNSNDGYSNGRGVVFASTADYTLGSVAIFQDLTNIDLSYSLSVATASTGSVGGGTVIASGMQNVTTNGLEFISFDTGSTLLTAGTFYLLSFSFSGNSNQNFFFDQRGSQPYDQAGFTGIDGTSNGETSNFVLAQIRLSEGMGAVPEPATWAFMIFGFGAIGGALRRNRKANVKVSYA